MIKTRRFFLISILFLIINNINSYAEQKTFDLYLTTGYGFGAGGRFIGSSQTYDGLTLVSRKDHYQNFGQGIKIEAGMDYLASEKLYVQAGFSYSIGVPIIEQKITAVGTSTDIKYSWSTIGIKALAKPTFQLLDLFDVYAGFGIGLYFAISSCDIKVVAGSVENTAKGEDSNNPAFAIIGSLGLEYPIVENVIAFFEVYSEQMSFTTTKTEYTHSSFSTGPYTNHTEYYQKDVTDREPPPKIPGSNVALRIGVRVPIF